MFYHDTPIPHQLLTGKSVPQNVGSMVYSVNLKHMGSLSKPMRVMKICVALLETLVSDKAGIAFANIIIIKFGGCLLALSYQKSHHYICLMCLEHFICYLFTRTPSQKLLSHFIPRCRDMGTVPIKFSEVLCLNKDSTALI